MATTNCLWCDLPIRQSATRCADCGLAHVPELTAAKRSRRYRGLTVALLAAPLMLSAAFASQIKRAVIPDLPVSVAAAPAPKVFRDPVQESVWVAGQAALRLALANPSYGDFRQSFVSQSDGRVVAVCGVIAGTSGYDSDSGEERYISVFGQASATVRESQDMTFGVLWKRVCGGPVQAAA